jgi:hypothetical protein
MNPSTAHTTSMLTAACLRSTMCVHARVTHLVASLTPVVRLGEQVNGILAMDEDGIRKAWSKANASAGRNPAEKDYRLAYLTWRVWCVHRGSRGAKGGSWSFTGVLSLLRPAMRFPP